MVFDACLSDLVFQNYSRLRHVPKSERLVFVERAVRNVELGGPEHNVHFLQQHNHQAVMGAVPTSSELSNRICENLTGQSGSGPGTLWPATPLSGVWDSCSK